MPPWLPPPAFPLGPAALRCEAPSPGPTFHTLKFLRCDDLAVVALQPLEVPHPEPGHNPGAEQAHWGHRGSGMLRGREGCGEMEEASILTPFLGKTPVPPMS